MFSELLVLLLRKYDICLQEYASDCIEKCKRQLGSKASGTLIAMMYKSTTNKVIEVIIMLIQETIVVKERKAGVFSIQMDTTQGLTSKDPSEVVL